MDSFGIKTNVIKSVFGIPPHQWVRIRLHAVAYDNFNGQQIVLSVDLNSNYNRSFIIEDNTLQNVSFNNSQLHYDFCKKSNYSDALHTFDVSNSHTSGMIKIRIGAYS